MVVMRVLCPCRLFNDFTLIFKHTRIVGNITMNQTGHFTYLHQQYHYYHYRHSNDRIQCRRPYSTSAVKFKMETEHQDQVKKNDKTNKSGSSSSSSSSDSDEEELRVVLDRGLPQITVPLPSRRERCQFTLRPAINTVEDFLQMIRLEDKGIDRVVCKTPHGIRIASSTPIETLLQNHFKLVINDCTYNVQCPALDSIPSEHMQRLAEIQNLVGYLYSALNIKDHQLQKESEIVTELETLQLQLQPLEQKRYELEMLANRKNNWISWAGLGLMSVQFGILARLTWWEYSWDIMEPVTYFVTYGTAIAAYAYFVVTKEEYILNDVKNRQHLLLIHKKAKKNGFDLQQYNSLKDQIACLEMDLKRLRDPIKLRVPLRKPLGVANDTNGTVNGTDNSKMPENLITKFVKEKL